MSSSNEFLYKFDWLPFYQQTKFKMYCILFRVFDNWNCAQKEKCCAKMQNRIYQKKHLPPRSDNLKLTARFCNWYWRTCCIQTSHEGCILLWGFFSLPLSSSNFPLWLIKEANYFWEKNWEKMGSLRGQTVHFVHCKRIPQQGRSLCSSFVL